MATQASSGAPRVLVVDDEAMLADLLSQALRHEGWETATAKDGLDALAKATSFHPDVVILDVQMPRMDGLETLERLRARDPELPVLFLTARDAVADRVQGLRAGADDYVTKPFNPLELTARVKSQLRRYTQLNPNAGANYINNEINIRNMHINKDNHKVIIDEEEIKLTPIEFDILFLLASHPGKVFSTDEIFEKVWNEKVYEANNTVMVHIRRLRGKMKEDQREDKIITTVWGVGYKIEK